MEKTYKEFLETKTKSHIHSGFDIEESELSAHLFDFQKFAVKWALKLGRAALFEDCGLGKTAQMLEWAKQVNIYTNKKVLILAPLAVVGQTKQESEKFGVNSSSFDIINYEQIENIDLSIYFWCCFR